MVVLQILLLSLASALAVPPELNEELVRQYIEDNKHRFANVKLPEMLESPKIYNSTLHQLDTLTLEEVKASGWTIEVLKASFNSLKLTGEFQLEPTFFSVDYIEGKYEVILNDVEITGLNILLETEVMDPPIIVDIEKMLLDIGSAEVSMEGVTDDMAETIAAALPDLIEGALQMKMKFNKEKIIRKINSNLKQGFSTHRRNNLFYNFNYY